MLLTSPGLAITLQPIINSMNMFEYTKLVLTKVSFDKNLFQKELVKAIKTLGKEERKMLQVWCAATFVAYPDIVMAVFKRFSS